MVSQEKHLIVKKYLKNHSLVESNITSFNDFLDYRLQEIVDEISQSIDQTDEDYEIKLGKIEVGKPIIIESDGSASRVMPYEARLRNITYAAPINLELTVKKDDQVDSEIVEIGKIPVMVKSKYCNTDGLSREELINNYHDPLDPGGYFIIKGNERVMVMAEDLAENQPFIEENSKLGLVLKMFSLKGTYRIPTTIYENKEGNFETTFSIFKKIPANGMLKALGLTKESDIAN